MMVVMVILLAIVKCCSIFTSCIFSSLRLTDDHLERKKKWSVARGGVSWVVAVIGVSSPYLSFWLGLDFTSSPVSSPPHRRYRLWHQKRYVGGHWSLGGSDHHQLINWWIERNGKQLVFEDGVSRFRNQEKRKQDIEKESIKKTN